MPPSAQGLWWYHDIWTFMFTASSALVTKWQRYIRVQEDFLYSKFMHMNCTWKLKERFSAGILTHRLLWHHVDLHFLTIETAYWKCFGGRRLIFLSFSGTGEPLPVSTKPADDVIEEKELVKWWRELTSNQLSAEKCSKLQMPLVLAYSQAQILWWT